MNNNIKNDWRLNGQEEYLKGALLHFSKYESNTDHDHCEFCLDKFSNSIPGSLTEGYATSDKYRWICRTCFEDFKEYFKWKV